jgi:hypothetical protein
MVIFFTLPYVLALGAYVLMCKYVLHKLQSQPLLRQPRALTWREIHRRCYFCFCLWRGHMYLWIYRWIPKFFDKLFKSYDTTNSGLHCIISNPLVHTVIWLSCWQECEVTSIGRSWIQTLVLSHFFLLFFYFCKKIEYPFTKSWARTWPGQITGLRERGLWGHGPDWQECY